MQERNENKINIYLTAKSREALAKRDGKSGSRSSVIQRIFNRYDETCHRYMPKLSEEEKAFFCHIINDISIKESWSVNYLTYDTEDIINQEDTDVSWHINGKKLLAKMKQWGFAEKLAVVDMAEMFAVRESLQ